MNGRMGIWIWLKDGRKDGWIDWLKDGWKDGLTDGCADGWMNGWFG